MTIFKFCEVAAIRWAAMFLAYWEVSGLLGEFYTLLYRSVQQVLSLIRISGVSSFQGQIYISGIGRIVRTFKSVRKIEVSTI